MSQTHHPGKDNEPSTTEAAGALPFLTLLNISKLEFFNDKMVSENAKGPGADFKESLK
ncbi:MAG: hypothetical protein ACOZFS_06030 [Thermodesulfobacteriota bacterium]